MEISFDVLQTFLLLASTVIHPGQHISTTATVAIRATIITTITTRQGCTFPYHHMGLSQSCF